MVVHSGDDLVRECLKEKGKPYYFGQENQPFIQAKRWDCSELPSVKCAELGIYLPDGAYNQWKYCTRISVAAGIQTPGALLFVGDGRGVGRAAITHVAVSQGNHQTIEARGARYGTGVFGADNRFDYSALIPGLIYNNSAGTWHPSGVGGGIDWQGIQDGIIWTRAVAKSRPFQSGDGWVGSTELQGSVRIIEAAVNKFSQEQNSFGLAVQVDGVYDDHMRDVVTIYQTMKGLPVTGKVDEATFNSFYPV